MLLGIALEGMIWGSLLGTGAALQMWMVVLLVAGALIAGLFPEAEDEPHQGGRAFWIGPGLCALALATFLHRLPPGPFTSYGLSEYLREVRLLVEWWAPAQGISVGGLQLPAIADLART